MGMAEGTRVVFFLAGNKKNEQLVKECAPLVLSISQERDKGKHEAKLRCER